MPRNVANQGCGYLGNQCCPAEKGWLCKEGVCGADLVCNGEPQLASLKACVPEGEKCVTPTPRDGAPCCAGWCQPALFKGERRWPVTGYCLTLSA